MTEIVIFGDDVVRDAIRREGALENGRYSSQFVPLVMYHDPRPSKIGGWPCGAGEDASHVVLQTSVRMDGIDDFAPISLYGFAVERDGVGQLGGTAVEWGVVEVEAGIGVDEVVVWAEMEVESVTEGDESESKSVIVTECC